LPLTNTDAVIQGIFFWLTLTCSLTPIWGRGRIVVEREGCPSNFHFVQEVFFRSIIFY
jgi:hypothetical protein